nr:MAG TPA_asm: hypothetical protein [Caudoviricetes sp.]
MKIIPRGRGLVGKLSNGPAGKKEVLVFLRELDSSITKC